VTTVLDTTPAAPVAEEKTAPHLASWGARAGAIALDVLVPLVVLATLTVVGWTAPLRGWLWWVFVVSGALVFLAAAVNRWLLPAARGWTLGRAAFAIAVRAKDGTPVGAPRLVLRDLVHLVDTAALFLGWLWPLWDRQRRTFADLLLRTTVVRVQPPPRRTTRRFVGGVLIAAALVSAAAVSLSYAVVYRHERAVDNARAELAEQGPRIVEQLLSYHKDTLQQDFSHAQSLTTDSYREQLIAQQQAISQAGVTSNEYWAVVSAVLPMPEPTPTSGSMLLALQGQRGADPKDLKFITATVRVDFEKVDGHWRVANLTVLKKPQMGVAGQ